MIAEAQHDDPAAQRRPACPYFRLLADPEAHALSLGQQRLCRADHRPLSDLAWQASYCLGSYERCPHFRSARGQPTPAAGTHLLELLAQQQIQREQAQPQSPHAPRAKSPYESSGGGPPRASTKHPGFTARLAELVRRPIAVAVTTAALIGGLWAGIALAGTLGGNRPTADAGQRVTASAPAFTLRTERTTPTPTPFPAPAQLPQLPGLSVSRATAPTPTPAPHPSPTPTRERTPTATPTVTVPVATSPVPSSPVVPVAPAPTPVTSWPSPVSEAGHNSSSEPTPTPTVSLWPSPTPTPSPVPTPTPTPSPTPDPWQALPPMARAGQPVPVSTVGGLLGAMTAYPFPGNGLAGSAPAGSGATAELGLPANAGVLYGLQSGASNGRIWLNTPTPAQRLVIVAEGMTNPGRLVPVLRIGINGLTVWEGTSPFPHGEWATVAWVIDKPYLLDSPQLQVSLSLATPGEFGAEPWIALATVTIYAQ
uniref:Tat (Twin-arginine translocation) pathway signal sequence domain-containing protein n=1 Tax=Thermomicrobium roseum TaxID=500 RepID=A0A7C1FUW4_THERO